MQEKLTDSNSEIKRLQEELDQLRSQFYIFYELTRVMRTSLHLEELAYIILTGLTAHQGFGFNRAFLFLVNELQTEIKGFMGIGPIDAEEANKIWGWIESQQVDLETLIKTYRRIKEGKLQPKLMEFTRQFSFPFKPESGIIYECFSFNEPFYVDEKILARYRQDPLVKKMNLREFVIAPLRSHNIPIGVIIVDNYITGKKVSLDSLRILGMFINQAAAAIENSKTFEYTLMQAHTDRLTGLWNYGYFQYKLDEALIQAKTQNTPLSLIMLDIDDFKKFNDSFGHLAGDRILHGLANILRRCSRKEEIVCRYGGEEFALILPNTNKKESLAIAERIRSTLETTPIQNYHITVSIGISNFPEDSQEKEELIRKADLALYQAKAEGKNKIIVA